MVLNPLLLSTLNILPIRGFRKSKSRMITFLSKRLKIAAKLIPINVLPSPGIVEVVATIFDPLKLLINSRFALIERKDSEIDDLGFSVTTTALRAKASLCLGIRPSMFALQLLSTSDMVEILLCNKYRTAINIKPKINPTAMPPKRIMSTLGDMGLFGSSVGCSTI